MPACPACGCATRWSASTCSGNGLEPPHGIEAHAGLRELDLAGNRIADVGPLRALVALERLDLSCNRVADIAPRADLSELAVLVVDSNAVPDLGRSTHFAALEHLSRGQRSRLRPGLGAGGNAG